MPDWDLTDGRFRCIPRPRNATNILRLISTEAVSFELNSEVSPEKISCCFCCLFHRHHPIPRSALTHKNSRRAYFFQFKIHICLQRNIILVIYHFSQAFTNGNDDFLPNARTRTYLWQNERQSRSGRKPTFAPSISYIKSLHCHFL